MIAADDNGCSIFGHDITLSITLEVVTFPKILKILSNRVKRTFFRNEQNYSSTSITVRPLYVPQPGHAWCGSLESPHWGQLVRLGAEIF
jgi:hypothetical protein